MTVKRSINLGLDRPATTRTFHYVGNPAQQTSHQTRPAFRMVKRGIPMNTGSGTPSKEGSPSPKPQIQNSTSNSPRKARADVGGASLATNGLEGLMEQLDGLTPLERKQVLDHLALQSLSTKTDQDRDIALWSVAVQRGLVAILGGLDVSAYGVAHVRKLLGTAKTWRPVADLAVSLGMDKLQVVERQAAYDVLARVLLDYASASARRTGAALSLMYVVNCCQSIGAAFNAAFPGYIAGGCGPLLFAMMRKTKLAELAA